MYILFILRNLILILMGPLEDQQLIAYLQILLFLFYITKHLFL